MVLTKPPRRRSTPTGSASWTGCFSRLPAGHCLRAPARRCPGLGREAIPARTFALCPRASGPRAIIGTGLVAT